MKRIEYVVVQLRIQAVLSQTYSDFFRFNSII